VAGQNITRIFITQLKIKHMKAFNGIISVLLGLTSLYLMFINAKTDQDFIIGFVVLMASIIFLLFMMMEERNEEISELRRTVLKMKGII
jgi:hypothetical protein